MNLEKLLLQSIDLHVHVGPEIIPRRFTVPELLEYERGKLKGIAVKNHFFPTVAMMPRLQTVGSPFVVHSVTLNRFTGEWNTEIIKASAELSDRPIIVWFPTLHTEAFLCGQELEIAKEWIDPGLISNVKLRSASDVEPLSIFDCKKRISKSVYQVLQMIKETGAVLATGHLSWQESEVLVEVAAREIGITKIIITHPVYQRIRMPIAVQKKLVALGAVIEHCYSMYKIDGISLCEISRQIKAIGSESVILSSDVGQTFSLSPSEALAEFAIQLQAERVTIQEIRTMLSINPARLVGD